MFKTIFAILIILSLNSTLFSDEPDKNLHLKCLYPTVIIESDNASGSGIIVNSKKMAENVYFNIVITSSHIFSDYPFCSLGLCKYENWSIVSQIASYRAYVYKKSSFYDMAVLIFESTEKLPEAELDFSDKHYIGNEVFKFGFGQRSQIRHDKGHITSVNFSILNANYYRTSIYTLEGDSGGPLFDKDYKVIGITKGVFSSIDGSEHYNSVSFFAPIPNLEKMTDINFIKDKEAEIPDYPIMFSRLSKIKSSMDAVPLEFLEPKIKVK